MGFFFLIPNFLRINRRGWTPFNAVRLRKFWNFAKIGTRLRIWFGFELGLGLCGGCYRKPPLSTVPKLLPL